MSGNMSYGSSQTSPLLHSDRSRSQLMEPGNHGPGMVDAFRVNQIATIFGDNDAFVPCQARFVLVG